MGLLNCVSCGKEVATEQGKLYAQIFVCPDCYTIAERIQQRGERELRAMLSLMKETIRLAILKHELGFMELKLAEDVRTDLVTELAKLAEEARKAQREKQPCPSQAQSLAPIEIHSKVTTLLDVTSQAVGGKPTSG